MCLDNVSTSSRNSGFINCSTNLGLLTWTHVQAVLTAFHPLVFSLSLIAPPPSIIQTSASDPSLHRLVYSLASFFYSLILSLLRLPTVEILSRNNIVICKISRHLFCCASCPKFQLMLRSCYNRPVQTSRCYICRSSFFYMLWVWSHPRIRV